MRRSIGWIAALGVGSLAAGCWIRMHRWPRLANVPADANTHAPGDDEGAAGDPSPTPGRPADAAESAGARSVELRRQMAEQAEQVARTEEAVAETFERLADHGGPREPGRRATAREARDYAELERRRAAHYRTTTDGEPAADDQETASGDR